MTGVTDGRARPLGKYPHAKRAGDFIFISGTSSRRPDGEIGGAEIGPDGTKHYDIARQTELVLENIQASLRQLGADLTDCVEIVVFLVDMDDFPAYNQAYGRFFDAEAPTRTTVAVRALPHPDMRVEMKAVAYKQQG